MKPSIHATKSYDQADPSKQHFPLIRGNISFHMAHNVIHWGLSGLAVGAILISVYFSPIPVPAIISIFVWWVFGYAYNSGLSKESLLGFFPISICFTAMGLWGFFLSHPNLSMVGIMYAAYVFLTILYQISWSGNLKELQLREKGNILTRMGARLIDRSLSRLEWLQAGGGKACYKMFVPGKARFYAYFVKGMGLLFGALLLFLNYSSVRLVWLVILGIFISFLLRKTTKPRLYNRGKELFHMSLMEILTIYLPIPLMLGLSEATILMVAGVLYFFLINLVLWGKPYPRV